VSSLLDRVLVIGGSGQLGREIVAVFADRPAHAPAHADLDLEQADAVLTTLGRLRPTLVVNAAAYHHVERCEAYPERAFAVNALAVDRLAAACALAGAALVTFSTDYVFDGLAGAPYRESDGPNPLSAYGASKLAGEHLVRRHGGRHFIVRTSGLYGRRPSTVKGYTFIDRVLRQAEAGEPVRVVDDVTFSPSFAPHVATALRALVEREAFGTYHVSDAGAISWFTFACEAFALRGLDARPEAVSAEAFAGAARRPKYSALAHEGIARAGLPPMPDWRQGLEEYLQTRN
jgi:dTDP-4-dehydrorhamnose reductase